MKPKLIVFAGSLRKDSYNKKLAKAAAQYATAAGAQVEYLELNDYPMPLFDQDIEDKGMPESVVRLRTKLQQADGLLIACPEYNSSITGVLKNTIDWTSRPDGEVPGLVAYKGKVIGLLSTSTGALGGLRGLVHVRQIFGNIGCIVIPQQYAAGGASKLFDANGDLVDAQAKTNVEDVVTNLVKVCQKLIA